METPFETLQRLPGQLRQWLRSHWAQWLGRESGGSETVYWGMRDALDSAGSSCSVDDQTPFGDRVLAAHDPLFTAREAALEGLAHALQEWRSGRASMVAVHGPQGCGISSLLEQVQTLADASETVLYTRLGARLRSADDVLALFTALLDLPEQPADIDALTARLRELPPRIIVLDDAYMLAYRVMGSRTAVRTLGSILVASQPQHLWILGFRRHAWRRMQYMYQADRYFTHNIELDYFTADELKAVVAARFEAAGTPIDWPPNTWNRLHQYSRGKPDLSFLYARLLQERPQDNAEQPDVLRPIDLAQLRSLDMDDLFTLAEIAVHGHLTLDEHQTIFRDSAAGSLMRLEHLNNRGLLERCDIPDANAASYRIKPLLSGLIADHLYKVNYLY